VPITDDDKRRISQAVKDGRIADARSLLHASNDPQAASILKKLDAKYPPVAVSRSSTSWVMLVCAAVAIIVVLVAGVVILARSGRDQGSGISAGQTQAALSSLAVTLEIICQNRFYDGVEDQKYTSSELEAGCQASIQNTLDVWPDQIAHCVNTVGSFSSQLSKCLDAQNVVILRSYIIQARDHPELLQTPDQSPTLDWAVLTEFPVTQSFR
jgi:hypothetical protein